MDQHTQPVSVKIKTRQSGEQRLVFALFPRALPLFDECVEAT